MNRPLFFITAALIFGMVAAGFTSINYIPAFIILGVAVTAYIFLNKKFGQLVFLVFAVFGMALFSFQDTYVPKNDIRAYLQGVNAETDNKNGITAVKVLVRDDPEYNDNKTLFYGELISVFEKGREITGISGQVRVTLEKDLGFKPRYGDILYIKGKLREPEPPKNLGEFDYKRYLRYKQVFYTVFAKDTACEKQGSRIDNLFKQVSYGVKYKLLEVIYSSVPKAEADILNGLMLGNQRVIPDDVYDRFKITGTVHILAVSGMNVGLIGLFIFLVLKVFRVKRKAAAVITLLFIIIFAVITGAGASIVRATIMGCVVLVGQILEKDTNLINSLSIAAFILLLFNPSNLYDVGFQLSFLATFGIIYFIDWVEAKIKGMPKWLSGTLASSVAAQLFLTPVMADTFHQTSVISVLANIFIVPLSGMISILGFAMWLFGSWSAALGKIFGASIWVMIKFMMLIVDTLAKAPYAAISIKTMPALLVIIYYLFFIILPYDDIDIKLKNTGLKTVLGISLLICFPLHLLLPGDKPAFYALSARGVNAALLVTGDNKKVLMLGRDDYKNNFGVKNTLIPFLRYEGVNNIDKLVLYSVENSANIAALKRSFMIKGIAADPLSFARLDNDKGAVKIAEDYYIKEGSKTFLTFSTDGVDAAFGDKEILFLKSISPGIEKRTGCVIYSCVADKNAVLPLAKNNICVINSANEGFYRKPPPVEADNIWDLSEKGMFKYP